MDTEQMDLFNLGEEKNSSEKNAFKKIAFTTEQTVFIPEVKADEAYQQIKDCTELSALCDKCNCCSLYQTRTNVVFGQGNLNADIMFIGEGPGKEEDLQGIPFVGRAGQLLDKILLAAEFKREEVYICNVVKCRPPSNRLPMPEEVKACRSYLEAQIRIIDPKIIVCLGSLASQTIIDPKARITRIRGKWFWRNGRKIMATFHPAALLRNESYKRPTWEDFKIIRDEYKRVVSCNSL